MRAIEKQLSHFSITKAHYDEFAAYYLGEAGKTLDELDEDYRRFEAHEQYTEDGLLGLQMSESTSHTEVVLELDAEITAEYLPEKFSRSPNACNSSLWVMKSAVVRANRPPFTLCRKIENSDNIRAREAFLRGAPFVETKTFPCGFSLSPLCRGQKFPEWIDTARRDFIRAKSSVMHARRHPKSGESVEFIVNQTVNPDFEEKQYASQILQIFAPNKWNAILIAALRRNEVYQNIYLKIRSAKDTAVLAQTARNRPPLQRKTPGFWKNIPRFRDGSEIRNSVDSVAHVRALRFTVLKNWGSGWFAQNRLSPNGRCRHEPARASGSFAETGSPAGLDAPSRNANLFWNKNRLSIQ